MRKAGAILLRQRTSRKAATSWCAAWHLAYRAHTAGTAKAIRRGTGKTAADLAEAIFVAEKVAVTAAVWVDRTWPADFLARTDRICDAGARTVADDAGPAGNSIDERRIGAVTPTAGARAGVAYGRRRVAIDWDVLALTGR